MKKNKNSLGLYIHWPYCESKCPYCDFNSHINVPIDQKLWIEAYTNQLYEMRDHLQKYDLEHDGLNSIFFGGGTPSLMPLEIIDSVINLSLKIFKFSNDIEISLEANPSSYEIRKFLDLKKIGINRLSIGVQSLNDHNLKFLGRLHNLNDINNALDHASETFDNISTDLMYAFYGQDLNLWISELETFLQKYNLKHISLYQLTIEEGTKFFTDYKKGLITLIDNDEAYNFYSKTNKILNNYGFKRYEVSNYSKINFECKHNLNYWNSDNWIGIGPGAYGRIWKSSPNKQRIEYQNYKNPKTWLNKNIEKPNFEKINFLNCNDTDIDTLSMGLRLENGFEISKLINYDLIESKQYKKLEKQKIIFKKDGFLKLDKNYIIKLNSIINYLIDI